MRNGPLEHGGLLQTVRQHPVAQFCVVLALLAHVLIGLSPLWVPAVERAGIEVCTADGIRIIPADQPGSDTPLGEPHTKGHCPLCTIQAAFLLPPADVTVAAPDHAESAVTAPAPSADRGGLFAGFDHLSRAPPLRT